MPIGDSGYVFIAGSFQETVQFGNDVSLTSNGWIDTFIAKYDTSGNCIWAINMGGEYDDYCYSIVLDENGNIYGTGFFGRLADFDPSDEVANLSYHGPLPLFSDAFIAKYDSNGNYLWANSLGGEITDRGWFVKVDHAKDVYVTGPFDSNIFYPNSYDTTISTNGFSDIFIAKYDSNRNFLWVTNIGGPLHDEPYFMDIDDSNNFVITGSFTDFANFNSTGQEVYLYGVNNNQDVFLAKYESNGNNIWAKSFGSSSFDFGRSLGIHNNDIYLAGTFSGDITINSLGGNTSLTCGGLGDIFLTKFNSDGENILTPSGISDLYIASYSPDGNYNWAMQTGSELDEVGFSLDVDDFGTIYLTGYFYGTCDFDPTEELMNVQSHGNADIFLAKYSQPTNFINENKLIPNKMVLLPAYPNPVTPLDPV